MCRSGRRYGPAASGGWLSALRGVDCFPEHGCPICEKLNASNGVAFTREGKLVPKPTGYELKKLSPREPNFRPPFERISDPQIPLKSPII